MQKGLSGVARPKRLTSLFLSGNLPGWVAPVLVWVLASSWLLAVYIWMQGSHADQVIDGFKLRDESSDSAWQTIRLWEMWKLGPQTLWQMHIYPPLYDSIRFLLMQPEVSRGLSPSALEVDHRLYVVNALLFGIIAMVLYLWVRDLTKSGWWAGGAAAVWSLLPTSIAYVTLLSNPGLAMAAMTVAFYLLYRFCRTRRNTYALGFLIALLAASLTRNVVQIHVLAILVIAAVAFFLMGRPRSWWALGANLLLVALIAVWPVRAYVMYGTFDVSTHTGYNRAGTLWINPKDVPEPVYPQNLLRNATLLSSGWNTQETLKDNYRLGKAANDFMVHHPVEAVKRLVQSLQFTIPAALRSVFTQWYNAFLFNYPLAHPLDWVFSGWRLVALIFASFAVIFVHAGRRRSLGYFRKYGWFVAFWILTALPVAFSNRFWPIDAETPFASEADRLSGLLAVPLYALMALAACIVVRRLSRPWQSRRRQFDA